MPNIASVLKDEIARVARKEMRAETQRLKKASAQYRSTIATLKRRLAALEKQVARLGKTGRRAAVAAPAESDAIRVRFSAKGLIALRRRLGLSAPQAATLLGVSAQSIYKWEDGKNRPRASQLPAIASLRSMGKKQAAARLSAIAG
ncbi:MAG: helix-turn-helix transcriptional regulator [Burkholderiaceae bacterium]|nr:helix-turn-helix transcriptional regulator [Burkholderiaceae bacterium]MDO9090252.1 helix-turn-helix transcriptional regulator [Burkholderiaceae bacterium]